MKRMAVLTILLVIASPLNLEAFNDHRPVGRVLDTVPPRDPPEQERDNGDRPHRSPKRPNSPRIPHPIHSRERPHPPGARGRPLTVWPGGTTVVREIQPIIIIAPPSPEEPPPAPEPGRIWVPPVMETQTEPGYWDYGIRKVWMGDHWRYEQDFDRPVWVPEKQVEVVRQEGYWKTAE
jgi:hypothetical protein